MRTKIILFLLTLITSVSAYPFSYTYKGKTLEYGLSDYWTENGYVTYAHVTKPSTQPSGAVEIPETVEYEGQTYSVKKIDYEAFRGCVTLTSIKIPNTITSMEGYAFYGCKSLTSVELPNSITAISYYTFSNCSSLASIEIPNSVTAIDYCAFESCSSLTSVVIPNSVTTIGNSAFGNCTNLTNVVLPNNLTTLTGFNHCTNLTAIEIPASVTKIGSGAFSSSGLTSIQIPNSVTTIESSAFSGCRSLTSVEIPTSVTTIGSDAFSGCSNLPSVEIPNSVTSIGDNAFSYCDKLAYLFIPTSVEYIGNGALNTGSYNKVVVPKSLKIEGLSSNVFLSQYDPEDILIEDGVVYNASKTTLLAVSPSFKGEYIMPNTVTAMNDGAFSKCAELTSVAIANSLTSLGQTPFYGCTGLQSVNIGNGITSIGENTFNGLTNLQSVTIGNSVTTIGNSAFRNCQGLKSLTLGNSVTTIGEHAFECCYKLESLEIPNSVTYIGDYGFNNCSGLQSVSLGNSVTSIGNYTFYQCPNLASLEIPNSVTYIGDGAFRSCKALKSLIVPPSVQTMSESAFEGTSAKVACPNTFGLWGAISIPYDPYDVTIEDGVIYDSAKTKLLFASTNLTGGFCIPNTVVHIGDRAFWNCNDLTSIFIPESCKTCGGCVFDDCYNLRKIAYPAGVFTNIWGESTPWSSNIQSIPYDPQLAKDMTVVNGVVYGSAKSTLLFAPIELPEDYAIPASVKSIHDYAFYGCDSQTSIVVPDGVAKIGHNVFDNCSNLQTLELGAGVESIGALNLNYTNFAKLKVLSAFAPKLASMTIPASASIEIIKEYYPRFYSADVWKDFVGQMGIEGKYEMQLPGDELVIPGADMACEELTLADPKTGRVYVVDAYGMTSGAPFLYIKGYQVLPVNTLNENDQIVGEGVDTKFVLPSHLVFTDKQPEGTLPVGENMMWICDAVDKEAPAGVRYFDLPVAGAKLNIADVKTGRLYAATAHGLNTETPILHISNVENIPATATQETGTATANKQFFIPAKLTFTNKVPAGATETANDKITLWACDVSATTTGTEQCFTIPVTGVNMSDEFRADYTDIYIEDSERPLYLYQNLPARFKRDMGDACAVNLYLGRDAVNKSGETALFGLGSATNSETYPLKSITLGKGLRNIYDNTFAYANQLMEITFAGDNCLQAIGAHAFEGLRWSKPITFPSNLKMIGKYAFAENRYLNTISFGNAPDLTIDEGAFQYCQRLASVNYASQINRICKYAFRYCESYNGVIDIKAFAVDESAFERCQFTDLTLNIGLLGKNVFRNINSIRSLRGTIDCVGEGAFAGCVNLKTVDIDGNASVCSNAFGALQKLDAVSINIPEIKSNAFYSAESSSLFPQINTLTLGNDVNTIGDCAFYGLNNGNLNPCDLNFGTGLKSVGAYAFAEAHVNKVHFAKVENANPVMTVGDCAFTQITVKNETLPAVSLGNTVKSIGQYNFNAVDLKQSVGPNDVVLDLGSSIESIGNYCFNVNRYKTAVTLPGSTKTVGYESFMGFNKINIAPGSEALKIAEFYADWYYRNGFTADFIELNRDITTDNNSFQPNRFWASNTLSFATDKNSTFTGKNLCRVAAKKIVFGKYCKQYPLTAVCQEVDIKNGVESINDLSLTGNNYDYGWSDPGSRSIILPASLTGITNFAIANSAVDALIINDGTKPLTFGSAPKTGNYLSEIYVGRNTSLANANDGGVFQSFPYLEKVVVGPKVSEITPAMFKDCPKLTNIIFGREDAADDEDVIAEMQLKKISDNAFQNCRGLEVLSLPETLEVAGADAFHGFQGLQRIVARGATPALGTVTWGTAIEDCVELYYPQASENKYRASDMFYPFFNAGHAFTNEGNIADAVTMPLTDDNVEDLDEVAEGQSYNLPEPLAVTTEISLANVQKRRSNILKSPTDAQPELVPVATNFYWFSPNPDIATVDSKGKVTVLKNEPAEIWVYALDGSDRKAVVKINQPVLAGDMNRDSNLDVMDITSLTIRVANDGRCSKISDVNTDGELDVIDVTELLVKVSKQK